MRMTGELGHSGPGAMASENYGMTSPLAAAGIICIIEFDDFARFAQYWLYTGSDMPADLYEDNMVNFEDMRELADLWLFSCPYEWPLR